MFNKNVFNPAAVAEGDKICVSTFYRAQWIGIEGSPTFMGINAVMPKLSRNMGVGLSVFNDNLGKYNRIQIEGSYAYSIYFKDAIFSMGLKVGVLNMSFNDLNWITPDTEVGGDPNIVKDNSSSWSPNFGIGFQYIEKKWYAGVSVSNLLEQNNSFSEVQIRQKRQFYFTGGYTIRLNSTFKLMPNIFMQTDLLAYQIDVNVNTKVYDNLIVGATYRLQDAFSILLGYSILDDLHVYYSYDMGISKISSFNNGGGAHELSVKYCFSIAEKVKKSKKNRNVRFL
jgi:type IX secretion system PorP/SprF family membrane protein